VKDSFDQLSLDLIEATDAPVRGESASDAVATGGAAAAGAETGAIAEIELHPEQRAVVELASDFVVTAGAGSGKTRTLVALYSALLRVPGLTGSTDPIGPLRILCLTFTERAARELMRKVRERIDPRWKRDLESAPISTFHGWCADLLRRYPLEAGVDPSFTVLSEESAEELLRTAAVDSLRQRLEQGDEAARQAVEIHGLGGAAEVLADLVTRIRTAGWPVRRPIERFEERLAEAARRLDPLGEEVEAAVLDAIAGARGSRLRTGGQREALARVESALGAWRAEHSVSAALELAGAARSAGSFWRFDGNKELRRAVEDRALAWAALAREIENRFQLGIWPALTVTVRLAYRGERNARGVLDYDDLLLRVRELLMSHPEVRDEVRSRYRAVLVDEHQDTDPVQDEIVRILIGPGAIEGRPADGDPRWCVVGDAKQSIYGFRGATVAAFEALSRAAAGRDGRRELTMNYRARAELVDFHNAFFPSVLVAGPGANRPEHTSQRSYRGPGGGAAVEFLDPPDGLPNADEARELEAMALAARIAAACSAGPDGLTVDDETTQEPRLARAGDVVILLRRLTQVEPYRRALDQVGLESVVVGSGSFWVRQETFDVLNALDAALRPNDPVPLVAFLRSPMAGLADDAIWRLLRGWQPSATSLRRHVAAAAADVRLEPEQSARLDDALDVLEELRARADTDSPGVTVAWLVDRTGYAAVLDALPDRGQRRANLERLIVLADRAPAEGHALLSQWANAVRRRARRPPRDRDASLPEVGDRVRILTIHQAKGLEFPIVVVGDLGGRGTHRSRGVRFDPELGVVAKVWIDPSEKPVDTRVYALAREAARERESAEEARLLYVAATRARDHLILSAGAAGSEWLKQVRAFALLPEAALLMTAVPLRLWADRFSAALGQTPALAGSGRPVHPPSDAAPGEASSRELAAMLGGEPPVLAPMAAALATAADALARGARGHAALERLPLAPLPADLAAWLTGPGSLPADEARLLADYARRRVLGDLASAAEVHREHPFRLKLPAGGIVVGLIDVLWRDAAGGWWVGDYKFAEADPGSAARHEAQLAIYALAASAALGLDEIGGRLWYVDRDERVDLRWSAADLRALETRLDGAFARLPHATANAPSEETRALAAEPV
jgi:ATP-dependent exoDNAse (exonuclease V) beta subunit